MLRDHHVPDPACGLDAEGHNFVRGLVAFGGGLAESCNGSVELSLQPDVDRSQFRVVALDQGEVRIEVSPRAGRWVSSRSRRRVTPRGYSRVLLAHHKGNS